MADKKKSVHRTGALAAVLDSLEPAVINYSSEEEKSERTGSKQPKALSSPFLANQTLSSEQVIEIDPNDAENWLFHDRPDFELGDISALAEDLKKQGQQQPCIVRHSKGKNYKFEIVAGERRWRATKLAGLKLKVLVKDLKDTEAALIQASENAHRQDLSDYAKGMSFHSLIQAGVLTQKGIAGQLNISQTQIARLLSFAKIPAEVMQEFSNPSKITARTAAEIRAFANKGQAYINALIQLAPKLSSGELGGGKLVVEINKLFSKDSKVDNSKEILNKSGRHLFTWRKDSNSNYSISFPKGIRENVDRKIIEEILVKAIDRELDKIKEIS